MLNTENHEKRQNEIMASIIQNMVQLDYIRLAILSCQLSEHQFNILQHRELERLRSSEDDQPLPNKKDIN